jgi:protein-tyrosine phosphatase
LAVGGRPALAPHALASEHALAAVVDLRAEGRGDARALQAAGVAFLHLPTPDHHAIAPPSLAEGVAFAGRFLKQGRRVLVHCEHGIGRAPTLALCLMCESGQAPLDALRRLKTIRPRVSPSVAQYHGFAEWLRGRGVAVPHFDDFALIAYRSQVD